MKRFLALLALVLVLMASTAGMASALTIGFDDPPPGYIFSGDPLSLPYPPAISGTTHMYWDGTGWYEGHLWCDTSCQDSIISFTSPTYVNSFQMSGVSTDGDPYAEYTIFGPMTIAALNAGGATVWSKKVENLGDYIEMWTETGWLTVTVNTPAVSSIVFKAPNYPYDAKGPVFWPSIDNLVIKEVVPIPASVWLLGSGLLGLAGWRLRKR
jgi:hypothetical protein